MFIIGGRVRSVVDPMNSDSEGNPVRRSAPSLLRVVGNDYGAMMGLMGPAVAWALYIASSLGLHFRSRSGRIVGGAEGTEWFMGMGVIATVAGLSLYIWRTLSIMGLFKRGKRVAGKITSLWFHKDRGRVEYSYEFEGSKYASGNAIHKTTTSSSLGVGEKTAILVDPSKPGNAIIEDLYSADGAAGAGKERFHAKVFLVIACGMISSGICLSLLPMIRDAAGERTTRFSTAGHPKARGLAFSLEYPSSWRLEEGATPITIQMFIGEDKACQISIGEFFGPITREILRKNFHPEIIKGLVPRDAKLITAKATEHDGEPGGWLVYSHSQAGTEVVVLDQMFIREGKLVQLQCSVEGMVTAEKKVAGDFEVAIPVFQKIRNSIVPIP